MQHKPLVTVHSKAIGETRITDQNSNTNEKWQLKNMQLNSGEPLIQFIC